jgi:hypothetical protein
LGASLVLVEYERICSNAQGESETAEHVEGGLAVADFVVGCDLMARVREHASNAQRQAAYRPVSLRRQALADSGGLVARLAERDAAVARDRYADLLAARPGRVAGAPGWAKGRVEGQLVAALERVATLEATVVELRARLAASTSAATSATPGLNRAAERDRRRH